MADLNELYPSNSFTDKEKPPEKESEPEPRKPIGKVVSGTVKTGRKKTLSESFAGVFFGEQARAVGAYILYDVLIPAAKDTLTSIVKNGIEMLVYGETKRDNIRRDKDRTFISYNSMYDREARPSARRERERIEPRVKSSRFDFDEIVFDRRSDAETVLSVLDDAIHQYEVVSVAEFYDACDLESTHADRKWGWDNLHSAGVRRVRDGYVLELPRPEEIE